MGITPQELYARYPLNVTAQAVGGAQFDQAGKSGNVAGMDDAKNVAGKQALNPAGDKEQGGATLTPASDYRSALSAVSEIERLAELYGRVFVRWSAGPEFDLKKRASSRDYQSGDSHAGLSAVEISSDTHPVDIASGLSEYMFLRMKDKGLRPYVYAGERIGTDSDSHALIRPSKLLYTPDDATIRAIDRDFSKIVDLEDSISRERSRLRKIGAGSGSDIVAASLKKAEDTLGALLAKHGIDLNEQSTSAGSDVLNQGPRGAFSPASNTITLLKAGTTFTGGSMRLRPTNPALAEARTVFPYRVIPVHEAKKVLYPASGNNKIGKGFFIIAKGKWRGVPIYTLTLEERATCPSDCARWADCYGNNMRFARRISHHDSHTLCHNIDRELSELMRMYQRVCIRLHVLGDFFSAEYVQFWHSMMAKHKGLLLFGFTHWKRETEIGMQLQAVNVAFPERSWIRFSDQGGPMSANVEGEGVQCPEQTGKTASCLTCGLCWSTSIPISFKHH